MSLNWEFTDKERFRKLTEQEKKLNDPYIWGCMAIGIGEITERNAEEWHGRYSFANELTGPFYSVGGQPYKPTLDDVKKRIGLRTNVFPKRSKIKFLEGVYKIWKRDRKIR